MIKMNTSNVAGAFGYRPDLSTGNLASLSASGTCTMVFDLDHEYYMDGGNLQPQNSRGWRELCTVLVSFAGTVTSASGNVKCYFSDDGTATGQVPGMASYNNAGGQLSYSGDLALACMQLLVSKRFLRVVFTNGSTIQGASAQCNVATMDM